MNNTQLPSNDLIAKELLRYLHSRGKALTPQEVYGPLATILKLTSHQLSLKRHTTNGSLWENHVQAAREHLRQKGFLDGRRRGYWSLTDEGKLAATEQEKFEAKIRELGMDWSE